MNGMKSNLIEIATSHTCTQIMPIGTPTKPKSMQNLYARILRVHANTNTENTRCKPWWISAKESERIIFPW